MHIYIYIERERQTETETETETDREIQRQTDAALNLENSSTAWRYHRFGFNSWKSSDSVSLNKSDFVKATTGFEGGFQNF